MQPNPPAIRTDGLVVLVIYALATIAMVVYAKIDPEHRDVSIMFLLIGLVGTWRQFVKWQSAR